MSEEPLDLSPLDPTRGPAFDHRVAAIISEARVGAPATVVDYLSRWTRPALAAAATPEPDRPLVRLPPRYLVGDFR